LGGLRLGGLRLGTVPVVVTPPMNMLPGATARNPPHAHRSRTRAALVPAGATVY
jgi:hypothetical protein